MLMGVTWTMAGTGIILMLLRTYLNGAIIKHFCWDYYWALLALVRSIKKSFDKENKEEEKKSSSKAGAPN